MMMERDDGCRLATVNRDDFDNCTRKTLKELDVTSIDAIQYFVVACQILTFLLAKLDPKGKMSNMLIDEQEMEQVKKGLFLSQAISDKVSAIIISEITKHGNK
jgi:hypothetical protein